ncbi:PREDICTED: tyrosine-protein kinase Dnt [Nicrophorus vespilloides]|uniref:Tyrosine-protein kinase Dnt n=1 Tax=Nicrophorus vespilloides TaxID=110193 RepID=A0ABM1M753_NICVS|nr:PREDICTED: tyrosine-protein kinase Dnt [Nicrophorus vespilloides]
MDIKVCFFVLIAIQTQLCSGFLNFYMSLAEVHRFLGLEMELFYVRDGVVNDCAMNFVVPVPSKIESLYFTWESFARRTLSYSIGIDVSNEVALGTPKLNISKAGTVPNAAQTFSISLPCTGIVTAEVNVAIHVNITLMPINVTTLSFRRKKTCIKAEHLQNSHVRVDSAPAHSNSTNIFYSAVICATSLIAIIVSVSAAIHMKNKKLRRTREEMTNQAYLTAAPRNPTTSSYGSFRRMASYSLIDERCKDLQERIAELTIQRCRVRLNSVVLEGTFGRVYLGSYTDEEGVEEEVIIKTVTGHASQTQISLLLQEGMSMYSLNHRSILTILRVSIEDHTAPFLLYTYRNTTNMKVFLQKCKSNMEGVAHSLTTQEVVDMALQVIHAMQYLHKKHLLHKDLATRNCVIDDKLKVQIADNALSRDLFPADYYCLGDNENRPVKWLAIEGLLHKTFSTSSDVWSFGVLLWELTTLAQQPYVEIDPFEMAAYLKDGYRLAQPINCPDELFAVMAYCWAMSAEERPTFSQLQVCLQDFYAQLTLYV